MKGKEGKIQVSGQDQACESHRNNYSKDPYPVKLLASISGLSPPCSWVEYGFPMLPDRPGTCRLYLLLDVLYVFYINPWSMVPVEARSDRCN